MTFIKTSDREGSFKPEAVTHFTVHSTIENIKGGGQHYLTFIKIFVVNTQIAGYVWTGNAPLTYEIVGAAMVRAEQSREAVMSFSSLIESEISLLPEPLTVS